MNELNLVCYIINLVITLLCSVVLAITPMLTRKTFLFGVRIPESAQSNPKAIALKKRYVTIVILGSIIIALLETLQFVIWEEGALIAMMYFPLMFVIIQLISYIPCWKEAKKLKKENNWTVLTIAVAETKSSYSRGRLSTVPWIWHIISLLLIFVCIIIGFVVYPDLPDKIPTHFDINMQPDIWKDKSIWVIMMMPLVMLGMLLMMILVGIIFERAKLQISPQNPSLSFAQHKIYRRRMGHAIGIMNLGMTISFGLLMIPMLKPYEQVNFGIIMIVILLPVLLLIIVSVTSGQGGCKLKPKMNNSDELTLNRESGALLPSGSERSDDKYWILGMFYYNPDDPALIVEDRFGNNIGFNYSRLAAKIIAIATIVLLIATYVVVTILLI